MQVAVRGAHDDLANDFRRLLETEQHLLGDFGSDLRRHEVLGEVGVRVLGNVGHHFLDGRNDHLEHDVLGRQPPGQRGLDHLEGSLLVGLENGLVVRFDDTFKHVGS